MDCSVDEIKVFSQALRDTNRTACDRYIRELGITSEAPQVILAARQTFRQRALLGDPQLLRLACRALADARGAIVDANACFPSTIWLGGARDTYNGWRFTGTLGDFVSRVLEERAQKVAAKREGWVVTPTKNADGHRCNASTVAMVALNLDSDGAGPWLSLLRRLDVLGYGYIAYQSGGWAPGVEKWHVLVPLATPFEVTSPEKQAQWKFAYQVARVCFGALGELLGEGFDPTVEAPSQPVFITERRSETDQPRKVVFKPGCALDLHALASAIPVVPVVPAIEPQHIGSAATAELEQLDDARLEEIVQAICAPMTRILEGRRLLYLALAGVLLDRGVASDDVLTIIEEVSLRCPGDPRYTSSEVAAKHREHIHAAETTINKFERCENDYTRIGTLMESWPQVALAIDGVLPDRSACDMLEQIEQAQTRRATAKPPPVPQLQKKVADLGALQRRVRGLLRRKRLIARTLSGNAKVKHILDGVILEALLKKEDLAVRDGGYIVRDEKNRPLARELAMAKTMGMLSYALPKETAFEDIVEIIRPSMVAMVQDGETVGTLLKQAQSLFDKSGRTREKKERKRAEKDEKWWQHVQPDVSALHRTSGGRGQ